MELRKAKVIAERTVRNLASYCQRIEIAGSVRRGKPDVKDIEIVCELKDDPFIDAKLDLVLGSIGKVVKNGPKYKQLVLRDGINLDLFIVSPPAEYGVILAIRTGPAEFSKWLVTKRQFNGALPSNYEVKEGAIWSNGNIIPTPDEEELFKALDLPWQEPNARHPVRLTK